MPEVTTNPPGSFAWVELATSHQDGAKDFYGKLFGWSFTDQDTGPSGLYTTFELKGRRVGAAYTLDPKQMPGVPPHWAVYVSTADADASVARAAELGAQVLMPPFDVYDYGRMAVLKDPTGAVFSVWQAKTHGGIGIANEHGAFCWGQLNTTDTAKGEAFYTALFGWGAKTGSDDKMTYTEWMLAGTPIGGMMAMPPDVHGAPSHWLVYFAVDDCDAAAAKAAALGGNVCVPPTDIPGTGRFAVLNDPQGAIFAIYKG